MNKAAILCVDDEKIILDSLKQQLKLNFGQRFLYETAESANEALEIIEELEEERIRLIVIVSDWLMPGMKGDEFLVQVHQRFPDVVTILLSGQADPASIERALVEANLHCFLCKPWREKDLITAINSGLEKL